MFQTVDGGWRKLMKGVEADPDAMKQATAPGVLDMLQTANTTLATTQRRVEDHLETKRAAFPRFCFLSNDGGPPRSTLAWLGWEGRAPCARRTFRLRVVSPGGLTGRKRAS